MTTLLIVEDDPDMQLVLRLGLEECGFQVSVAENGQRGLDLFRVVKPDLVILDIFLGHDSIDGFEVCRHLRNQSDVPVIFLTSRAEDVDQLLGLALGADDYLVKPVSPRLLCARVNMALDHHSKRGRTSDVITDGNLSIDQQSRSVKVAGVDIDLTRIEFDLLVALASNPGRVVSRDEITSRVWGDWYGSDAHLDVHMSRLRKKILDVGGPRVGHAVRGLGFKLR